MSRTSPKPILQLGGVTLVLLGSCGDHPADSHPATPLAIAQEDVTPDGAGQESRLVQGQRGAQVYQVHCALCHGADGDGKGLVELDRPARSFQDGGFSFGNTPEAIFRTVSNGIGGTPMPGFAEALSESERHAVVAHVLTLMPEQVVVAPGSTVLAVNDRPQVARGSFPPVAEGLAMIPRGLLLGGLDGLSFQYDATDLRLLAVRQGGFVDRKDWENRGGDALLPMGIPIFLYDGGNPASMWTLAGTTAVQQPLHAELLATEVAGGKAWVEYALSEDGVRLAVVRESGQALTRGGWTGFRRSFDVRLENGFQGVLRLAEGNLAGKAIFSEIPGVSVMQKDPSFGPIVRHRREFEIDGGYHLNEDLLFGLEGTAQQLLDLQEALR